MLTSEEIATVFESNDSKCFEDYLFKLLEKQFNDQPTIKDVQSFFEAYVATYDKLEASDIYDLFDEVEVQNTFIKKFKDKSFGHAYFSKMKSHFQEKVGVTLIAPEGLVDHVTFQPWVEEALEAGTLKFSHYDVYRRHLSMSEESLRVLDDISTRVLDAMGNPRSVAPRKTQGLLMGDVQSGKTATFTGICHKAVDAGYKMIIVLTGVIESLRVQTLERMQLDLCGLKFIKNEATQAVTAFPLPHAEIKSSRLKDFDECTSISEPKDDRVFVYILKKNSRVLQKFLDGLASFPPGIWSSQPILLIDDEADSASLNTKKSDEDPTAINGLIRAILSRFERSAYLAVTATPFANIFIDSDLDDLFPRDYIFTMPPPNGYLGVEKLFSDSAYGYEDSEHKYHVLVPISPTHDQWENYKKAPIEALPKPLEQAIAYFILCSFFKHHSVERMSMLVHVDRLKNVQGKLKNAIERFVEDIKDFATSNACLHTEQVRKHHIYQLLEKLWDQGCRSELFYKDEDAPANLRPLSFKDLSQKSWAEVWGEEFLHAVSRIKIIKINSDSDIKKPSEIYNTPDTRVIVIGGDALSRGLTLDGLCVTYFSRLARTYDLLLQMGRWFGYRANCLNYMKIWISEPLIEVYGFLADVVRNFRGTLTYMNELNCSPSNFGLEIRQFPQAIVVKNCNKSKRVRPMPTAANKMIHAVKTKMCIRNLRIQTGFLSKSKADRQFNVELVQTLLRSLPKPLPPEEALRYSVQLGVSSGDYLWRDVPAELVCDLMYQFKVPHWNNGWKFKDVKSKKFANFDKWDVRLISVPANNDGQFEIIDGLSVNPSRRQIYEIDDGLLLPRRALVAGNDYPRVDDVKHTMHQPLMLIYSVKPYTTDEVLAKYEEQEVDLSTLYTDNEIMMGLAVMMPPAMKDSVVQSMHLDLSCFMNKVGQKFGVEKK